MTPALRDMPLKIARILMLLALPACMLPTSHVTGKQVFEITSVCISVLFLLHSFVHKDWQWTKHTWVRLGLAFWGWQILSTVWAYDTTRALQGGLIWGRFFLFGVALAYWILAGDERMQKRLFYLVTFYVCFLGLDALMQYIIRVDTFGNEMGGGTRLTGPFNKPIVGTAIVNTLFPVLLYAIHASLTTKWRLFYISICAAAMLAVFLSGERSALLLMILGLALTVAVSVFQRSLSALKIFLPAVLVIIAGFFIVHKFDTSMGNFIKDRQVNSIAETISNFADSPYGLIWQDGLQIIKDHPLLGIGARNIRTYWCDMGKQVHFKENCPLHPHNQYLELTADFGIIGLAMYLTIIGSIFYCFGRNFALWRRDPIVIGIVITLIVRFWPLITQTSYLRSMSAFPLWLMVGWGMALLENYRRKQDIHANK